MPEQLPVDAENAIATWLRAETGAKVVTETSADLASGTYRVGRIGGRDDVPTIDIARIDIEFFGADRAAARKGARRALHIVRTRLEGQTITDSDGATGFVLRTETEAAPVVVPYVNTNVRRAVTTVRVHIHTH